MVDRSKARLDVMNARTKPPLGNGRSRIPHGALGAAWAVRRGDRSSLCGAKRVKTTSFTDCSPIFVVGAGRSGTTLLQLMLNAHPQIAIAGELGFFDEILLLRSKIPDLRTPERIDELFGLLPSLDKHKYLTEVETVFPAARARLKADPTPSYEKLYRYILEGYGTLRGARRFGEKTPGNIRHLQALVSVFPNCKVIHVIRDPRANVASRRKMPMMSRDVITNTIKWNIDLSCGHSFAQDHSRNYCEIKYEDLVSDPVQTLERVCRFVDEAYDAQMLEYYRSSAEYVKDEPWKNGTQKPVYRSSIETWRRELSEGQIYLIEWIARRQMARYGYPRSAARLRTKLSSPLQVAQELFRWGQHKRWESRTRQRAPATIHATNKKLYHMLWRALVQR
jgi:Sulfotransferase family